MLLKRTNIRMLEHLFMLYLVDYNFAVSPAALHNVPYFFHTVLHQYHNQLERLTDSHLHCGRHHRQQHSPGCSQSFSFLGLASSQSSLGLFVPSLGGTVCVLKNTRYIVWV